MPIYEYRASGAESCDLCAHGFERLEKLSDQALTACPQCGSSVARVISAPHINKAGPSLSPDNIEKHGFTQYRKSSKGVYEKTAGKGPRVISSD